MKLKKGLILVLLTFVALVNTERPTRQLRFPQSKASRATRPRASFRPVFRPTEESGESEEDDNNFPTHQAQRPVVFRRPQNEDVFFVPRPQHRPQPQPTVQAHPVVPSSTNRPQQSPPSAQSARFIPSSTSFSNQKGNLGDLEEEEKEEESKPDRLTELLGGSKFDCGGKKLGYYADEGLGCEVFHYCADGVRHSWLCPAGQNFHQIHLICMPVGDDNICAQSQKYHFVNDYLYKPINEGTQETNDTLKYHDRFFPDGSEDSEQHRRPQAPRKQVQQFQPVQQFSEDDFIPQQPAPQRPAPQFRSTSNSGGRLPQFIASATPVRAHRPAPHAQRSRHRTPSFRSRHQQQDDDYDE